MIDTHSLLVYISIVLAFIGFVHWTRKTKQHLIILLASLLFLAPTLESFWSISLVGMCFGMILKGLYEHLGIKGD